MSFPNWFDEELIQQLNIKEIRRNVFPSSKENNPEELNPKKTMRYEFDHDGTLKNVNIKQLYEYITVGDIDFIYRTLKDEYGFSPVRLKYDENKQNNETIDQFLIYDKVTYSDNYLVYQEQKTGDYRFYMTKKHYWGSLSVDSIFNPTPQDVIVFGSPLFPQKQYFVENRVNESDVILYRYSKKGNAPIDVKTEKFPFQYKRSIIYNKEGRCTGFIDSTFNDNEYLTRKNSSFVFKDSLPIELIHESMSNKSSKLYIQVETFEYDFFE